MSHLPCYPSPFLQRCEQPCRCDAQKKISLSAALRELWTTETLWLRYCLLLLESPHVQSSNIEFEFSSGLSESHKVAAYILNRNFTGGAITDPWPCCQCVNKAAQVPSDERNNVCPLVPTLNLLHCSNESVGDGVILVDEGPQNILYLQKSRASFNSISIKSRTINTTYGLGGDPVPPLERDHASYSVCYERKPQIQDQEGFRTHGKAREGAGPSGSIYRWNTWPVPIKLVHVRKWMPGLLPSIRLWWLTCTKELQLQSFRSLMSPTFIYDLHVPAQADWCPSSLLPPLWFMRVLQTFRWP